MKALFFGALFLIVIYLGYFLGAMALGTLSADGAGLHIEWDLFKGLLAVTALIICIVIDVNGTKGVLTGVYVIAGITLVVIGMKHRSPGTLQLASAVMSEVSRKAEKMAAAIEMPKELPCDSSTKGTLPLYKRGGAPLVFVSFDKEKKRWRCYDRTGRDPYSVADLLPVDNEAMVAAINSQEPEKPPAPLPSPTPAPTVAAEVTPPAAETPSDSHLFVSFPAPPKTDGLLPLENQEALERDLAEYRIAETKAANAVREIVVQRGFVLATVRSPEYRTAMEALEKAKLRREILEAALKGAREDRGVESPSPAPTPTPIAEEPRWKGAFPGFSQLAKKQKLENGVPDLSQHRIQP